MRSAGEAMNRSGPFLLLTLVAGLLIWAYWPGAAGPSLLDDKSSVSVLEVLEDTSRARDFVLGDTSGPLGRPVSMATFVLERLLLDNGTVTSKKVNIILHALIGVFIAWLLLLLFQWAKFPYAAWMSVALAAVWLFLPLHVSTVLYVVQRMAMLACLFVVLSCISYLQFRRAQCERRTSIFWLLLVPVFASMAVFSKENALVVIPILLLMEVFWLQFIGADGRKQIWLAQLTLGLIAIGALSVVLLLSLKFEWLANRYGSRDFTLEERLLTQLRVVWDYMRQSIWPDMARLGLYHDDYPVSSSLSDPKATLYAALGWIALVLALLAGSFWREGRILAFGLFLFLAAHSLESTVWPLEIYFEHRNYLPSVGLIIFFGALLGTIGRNWPNLMPPLLAWTTIFLIVTAAKTGSQVQMWSNGPLLAMNHVNGHPESPRANIDMASHMASVGELGSALDYSERAYRFSQIHKSSASEREGDRFVRDIALSCIARKPLPLPHLQKIGSVNPERPLGSVNTFHVLVQMLQDDVCPEFDWIALADHLAGIYLIDNRTHRASANMYSVLAGLENALQRFDRAYAYTELFLALSPTNTRGQLMKLHFATALGKVEVAEQMIAALQGKQAAGELNVGEQQTLALYTEQP